MLIIFIIKWLSIILIIKRNDNVKIWINKEFNSIKLINGKIKIGEKIGVKFIKKNLFLNILNSWKEILNHKLIDKEKIKLLDNEKLLGIMFNKFIKKIKLNNEKK